jgi:hypothetical protein
MPTLPRLVTVLLVTKSEVLLCLKDCSTPQNATTAAAAATAAAVAVVLFINRPHYSSRWCKVQISLTAIRHAQP